MASPNDQPMAEGDADVHQPFTVEENIRKLNEIDRSIVQLMNHTSTALNAVSMATTTRGEQPENNSETKKDSLHSATDSFLETLHSVDVTMKRQIMALEEAGIVNLSGPSKQEPGNTAIKPSLQPNGMGSVGNLDVGWLNSRGAKVEREMEAELWQGARSFLEKEEGKGKAE